MIVYRITGKAYSDDLSGTGAKLFGGRWNSKGVPALYTSGFISLTLLEMIVHASFKDFATELHLVHIQFPDTATIKDITLPKLKTNWTEDHEYSRFIGDSFLDSKEQLLLKVPSALVPEEYNYVANPLHADFKKIKISKTVSFQPDKRFYLA